jgi:hypothetical protein
MRARVAGSITDAVPEKAGVHSGASVPGGHDGAAPAPSPADQATAAAIEVDRTSVTTLPREELIHRRAT